MVTLVVVNEGMNLCLPSRGWFCFSRNCGSVSKDMSMSTGELLYHCRCPGWPLFYYGRKYTAYIAALHYMHIPYHT